VTRCWDRWWHGARASAFPGTADGFELALRAVLGQQVTVRGATTLAGRLARLLAEPLPGAPPAIPRQPISAERLAGASLRAVTGIGLPRARAECILALARAVAGGELPELSSDGPVRDPAALGQRLRTLPGVGAWTAEYVVMRSLHWPDAFPDGDVALRKAMGGLSPARIRAAAEAWRPWRAYAAQHLWASLGDALNRRLTAPSPTLHLGHGDPVRRRASRLQGPGPAAER
jgi:AraC family transcriptional regulator of adaptative response / DNA-3-methyladenine glycosylase II